MLFPIVFVVVKAGLTSICVEEWLWTLGDFFGECDKIAYLN